MRPYKEQHFTKNIQGLTLEGKFLPAMDGVQVSVYYQDKDEDVCLVNKEILGRSNPAYPFAYIHGHELEPRTRGLLIFGMAPGTGRLELTLSLSAPAAEAITFYMGDPSPAARVPSSPPAAVEGNRSNYLKKGI